MALNIKDPTTDALARELSALTGETITDAVSGALRERLAQVRRRMSMRERADDLQRYIDRGRQRPALDDRTPEEILGYDQHGIPS
ncbi:MAG TPA: type II toxin-antitoxin system VapB family antitoxin [Arachnia sp.]|nr:type II toxin-antitoxin system VapB family antitoxin [Arachnia sp.]HMT85256.1 type II toxin-antitoxin system VapB family antitoxin [Arachnia sp.]